MTLIDDWFARGTRRALLGYDVFVVDVPAVREDAEPALVLHGFPTSSFDWMHALDTMRARRRVVLLDMPGYGFSSKPDTKYSLFAQYVMPRFTGQLDWPQRSTDWVTGSGGEFVNRAANAIMKAIGDYAEERSTKT